MIVLRLTVGGQAHEINLPTSQAVLGSSPTADVTLQHAGWADVMARCELTDEGLVIERADGSGTRVRLVAGQCMTLGDAVLEWVPPAGAQGGAAFGAYEHDPASRPRSSIAAATFALEASGALETSGTPGEVPAEAPAQEPANPEAAPSGAKAQAGEKTEARSASAPTAKQPVPVGFPEPDLGSELIATLRRAPFFVASAVLHLAVFFVLTLLWDTSQDPDPTGLGTLRSSLIAPENELGDHESPEDSMDVAEMDFESTDLDELLEMAKPDPATAPKPDPKSLDAELDEMTRETMTEPDIGVLPSQNLFRGKTRRRFRPTVAPSKLSQVFDGGGASKVNRNVAELVRNVMGGGSGRKGSGLDDLKDGDLLVVDGTFDDIEAVLRALKLPFDKMSPYELVEDDVKFKHYKVVFWNCGKVGRTTMRKLKRPLEQYVRKGGYLFTTDWSVGDVLLDAFPGYLITKGRKLGLPERVVDIQPAQTSRRHPLLDGVFLPGARGRWWLEDQSFNIEIGPRGKGKVDVLIEAPELRDLFEISPMVAVTFTHGRGRVLHVMGHYYQQAGNVAGTFAAHRLAMNFVLQKIEFDQGK